MYKPDRLRIVLGLTFLLCFGAIAARYAAAEWASQPAAVLRARSTDVIVGKVVSIETALQNQDVFVCTHYTAHVQIYRVEKGGSLKKGGFCDVRYWHREWKPGKGPARNVIMMTTFGYRGLPKVGDIRRLYLHASGKATDPDFDVEGPNGFEDPTKRPLKDSTAKPQHLPTPHPKTP